MHTDEEIIAGTTKWIRDVVIGCNFCPFAAKVVREQRVRYVVWQYLSDEECLQGFINECILLDKDDSIETTLIILPDAFPEFDDFLDLVSSVEMLLERQVYEGVYQVATFHPEYCFAGEARDDAANYTNRSPYPMLHILREESIDEALESFPDPESIPERNINFARKKGEAYMKMLRDACL